MSFRFTVNANRRDAAGLFALTTILLWFNQELFLTTQVPFFRDLGPYFYPMRFILSEALKAGHLPLWDRHMSMGFPLLADFQSGGFYPPHLIFLGFSFFTAIQILYGFHYLVGAWGAYRMCRHWGWPVYLAVIGGTLFSLGGTLVSLTNLLNHFQTAVWLPWVVYFWEKSLHKTTWRNFLGLVALSLVQFLAGSPELYLMTMALLLLDGIRIGAPPGWAPLGRMFVILGAVNVLVAGLGMAQILPTLELLLESRAGQPVDYSESSLWSLQPWSLISLYFLDKEVDPQLLNGAHFFFLKKVPFLITHYVGALSLLGTLFWLWGSSRAERLGILSLIVVSVVVAAGSHTPLYSLIYAYVPLAHLFRFPEKFFFITFVLLVFISLKGLHQLLERDRPSFRTTLGILAIALVPWLGLYLLGRIDSVSLARLIAGVTQDGLFSSVTARTTSAIIFHLERQIILLLGFSLILLLGKAGKLRPFLVQFLLPGLLFVDLSSANKAHHHLLEPSFVFQGSRIISNPGFEPYRIFYYPAHSNLHPSFYVLVRDTPPSFSEVPAIIFSNLLPNTGVFHGFEYMQEIDALRRWPYLSFLNFADKQSPREVFRLLGALNVQYITSFQVLPEDGITLVRHFPEHPSWLYKIDAFVPRVYVVGKAVTENQPWRVLERLSNEHFDPLQEVILDQPVTPHSPREFRAHAQIADYGDQRATVKASLNHDGILVLADSFYPGWHAYVNGKEAEILRANLFFRAVVLPAGEHVVEFRYEPRTLKVGLVISITTLLCLIFSMIFGIPRMSVVR
jgi:hypothetical protein